MLLSRIKSRPRFICYTLHFSAIYSIGGYKGQTLFVASVPEKRDRNYGKKQYFSIQRQGDRVRAYRHTHTDTHTRTSARSVSRREKRIYSPSHCLNGRSRRNVNFLCHGTIESAYTRGRNNVTSAKRDRKMKYRDVECSSVYETPRSKLGVPEVEIAAGCVCSSTIRGAKEARAAKPIEEQAIRQVSGKSGCLAEELQQY